MAAGKKRERSHKRASSRGSAHSDHLLRAPLCRLVRRHVWHLDACEDSAAKRSEDAAIAAIRALPCHTVAEATERSIEKLRVEIAGMHVHTWKGLRLAWQVPNSCVSPLKLLRLRRILIPGSP